MEIKATDVKALRDATGAGMMECKKALQEANGDMEEAKKLLRERGIAKVGKLAERTAGEGVVEAYLHAPDPMLPAKVGVLVELNCATDFVAKTDEFRTLARNIALHVAAAQPSYISRDEVPADVVEREKEIYAKQAEGKPENVVAKIVEGKLNSFFEQACLLDQPSIRDPKVKVADMVQSVIGKLGENIAVARFARFKVGERA